MILWQESVRVQQENQLQAIAKPRAIPPLGEYWLTDSSGGLVFPVYLSRDYPVKLRELSQPPLTSGTLHCGMKRACSVNEDLPFPLLHSLCAKCVYHRAEWLKWLR